MSRRPDPRTTQRVRVPRGTAPGTRGLALVVIHGKRLGARIDVHDVPVLIGRAPDCDFQIDHRSVSRHHCKVWFENEQGWVRDLDSTNRTYVNERAIELIALREGDHLDVGETVFKVVRAGSLEARYHEALYQLANTDSLTQLLNRRKFREHVESALLAARETPRPLCLVFVDLDHFKRINDEVGHLGGDEVLRAASAALRAELRADDIAGRLGGEEFAILMPDTPLEKALQRAESIRQAIFAARATVEGQELRVTASIGVTQWAGGAPDAGVFMRLADVQLFRAKAAGRNAVFWSGKA